MSCTIQTIKQCHRNGDTVLAQSFDFDVEIIGKQFFYESKRRLGGGNVMQKAIGNGMWISGENRLVFDSYIERRDVGMHEAYLKVIDQDGENTILRFEIEILEKEVHHANS